VIRENGQVGEIRENGQVNEIRENGRVGTIWDFGHYIKDGKLYLAKGTKTAIHGNKKGE
jgi:hypothetical protein